MGTRNLTMVVNDKQTKIAQYGQWDGHPSGQGATALEFARAHLSDKAGRKEFKKQLAKCRFMTSDEIGVAAAKYGVADGRQSAEQQREWLKAYPALTRNHGAEILQLVANSERDTIDLRDESDFVADSLFCEWAYVIDLDAKTFEVFKGFNQTPLTEADRFFGVKGDGGEYQPVRLLMSYPLNDLPKVKRMIRECEVLDEDEEETLDSSSTDK